MAQFWSGLRALRLSDCPDLSGMWSDARPHSFRPPSHRANVLCRCVCLRVGADSVGFAHLTRTEWVLLPLRPFPARPRTNPPIPRPHRRDPESHCRETCTRTRTRMHTTHTHTTRHTPHATHTHTHHTTHTPHTYGRTDEAFDQLGNTEAEPEPQHHRQGARSHSHVIAPSIPCLSQPEDPRRDPSHCARALICAFWAGLDRALAQD